MTPYKFILATGLAAAFVSYLTSGGNAIVAYSLAIGYVSGVFGCWFLTDKPQEAQP